MNTQQARAIEFVHDHGNQGISAPGGVDGRTLRSVYKRGWVVDVNYVATVTSAGYKAIGGYWRENARLALRNVKEWESMGIDTSGSQWQHDKSIETAEQWEAFASVEA